MESMPDPYTRLPRKLEIFRRFSYFTLFIERLTLAFWAMGVWIVVFCGLWLLKIPSALGEDAHRFAAILFYSGLTYFLWRGARVIRLPSPREADRRLEDSAGLWHRPLSRLTDRLINPLTEVARLLWEESARDARLSLHRLKIPVPRALMAAADPRALRLGGLLLLMCGFIMAGPSWKERLARGIFPFQFTGLAGPGDSVSVWITPPEYTGRPALVLRSPDPKHGDHKAPEVLEIPAGSTIKILVSGSGWGSPSVRIGAQTWPLEKSGEGIYGIERPFPEPSADKPEKGRIVVRQYFLTRATWNFISVEDFPPAIALDGEPEILPDGVLRFSLRVRDDYGVKDVVLSVDAPEKETASVVGGSYRETRPVMSPPGKDFGIAPVYDLTAHPWAGARAMVHFTAVDTQGVETQTPPIEILLPERVFTHPAARMIAAIRKTLIEAPEKDYDAAGVAVEDLLSRPSDFGNDSVTVLVLRAAASRLFYTRPSVETTSSLAALLWDTALRIEDGNLTHAVRDLKSAQEALEQALRDPKTSGPELERLMKELRSALGTYLGELGRALQKQMEGKISPPFALPDMQAASLGMEDLADFLDRLESGMNAGDRGQAEQMLAQLRRLTDMLDPSTSLQMPADLQMMQEGVGRLRALIDQQEDLRTQTEQREAEFDSSQGRVRQEELRTILDDLIQDSQAVLNDTPQGLEAARGSMEKSSAAFGAKAPDLSLPHQTDAIAHLKESQQSLQEQFVQRMKQIGGLSLGGGGMRYDPLGRPYGGGGKGQGFLSGTGVELPTEGERRRAQELQDLIRRRAGEKERGLEELDYYRRLLRRF